MGNSTKIALSFQAMNLDSILNALKEINTLSSKVELPKDLINQINDLTQSVAAMKASTESLGKTKVDTKQFKELTEQFKGIEQRVETLEKAVSAIFSGAGANNQLVNKITEIKNTVTDTTSAIKEMGQSLKQATDNVSPDEKKLASYRKQLEILKQIKEIRGKEGSISDSKASKASVEKQIEMLKEQLSLAEKARDAIKSGFDNKQWGGLTKNFEALNDAVRSIETLEDNFKGKKLLDDYSYKDTNLQKAIDSIRHSYSDLSQDINAKEKAVSNHLNGIMRRIAETSKQTIQEVKKVEKEAEKSIQQTSKQVVIPISNQKKEVSKEFEKTVNQIKLEVTKYSKDGKIQATLPIRVSADAYERLKSQIDEVVKRVQEHVSPIEIKVALVTGYKTKRNEELAEQLTKSLGNINDEKIQKEASKLIETLQRRLSEQIHLDIKVAGDEKAKTLVKNTISEIQDEISKLNKGENGADPKNMIRLQARLSDDSIANITKQLEDINWKPINIDLKRTVNGKNKKDSKSTQEELTPLGLIKATVDEITGAINAKTDAFKSEAEVVATEALTENTYLLMLLDSFTKIQEVLSGIKELSGTIGNFQFKIDNENLSSLVEAAGQISSVVKNNSNSVISNTNINTTSSKSNNIKEEIKATKELNTSTQETQKIEEQVSSSIEKTTEVLKARNEEEQKFINGLIEARELAQEYAMMQESFGKEDINTKQQELALRKKILELIAKDKGTFPSLKAFENIATWSDSVIQRLAEAMSQGRKMDAIYAQEEQTSQKTAKNYGEITSYAEKMDKALNKATVSLERQAKTTERITNNTKTLVTNLNDTNSKYPLSKNATSGLWRIAKNPKSDQNEAASYILSLAGDYVKTGSTEILDKLKDYTKSSNLSDKMKASIENSINRFINQLAKQVETAGKQATKEAVTPQKMKSVTLTKGMYKEWYRRTSGLGDSEFFEKNFERQFSALIKQGTAKNIGEKSNRYQVKLDVADTEENNKLLAQIEAMFKKKKKIEQDASKNTEETSKKVVQAKKEEVKAIQEVVQVSDEEARSVLNGDIGNFGGKFSESELKKELAIAEELSKTEDKIIDKKQQEKNIQKEIKEDVSKTVNEQKKQYSEVNLEIGFQKIKNNIAKYGNFNLSKKADKEGLAKQVYQYIKYQQLGGTKSISDLTDNQKALGKITAEYEKQIKVKNELINKEHEQKNAIEQSIQAESNNEKNIQNSVSKEKQELLQEASAIIENIEQKQLAKISNEELLDSYNRLLKIIDELRGKIKGSEFLALSYKAGSLEKEIGNRNIGQTVSESEKEIKAQNTLINNYKKLLEEEELLDKYKTLDKTSKEKINEIQYDNLAKLKNESISVYEAYERIAQAFKDLEATTATTQLPQWAVDEAEAYFDEMARIEAENQKMQEEVSKTTQKVTNEKVAIVEETSALKENEKVQERVITTKKEQQQLNQQTSTESKKIQSNIEETAQLYDTLGRKIDSNNSKILEGTKVIEESTGRIKVLYHGSNNDFDKFDPNLIGSRGTKFGSGAYFTFDEGSAKAYGTKVSEWFANITKIYENNAKLSEEELTQIFNKYKDKIQKLWGSIDLKTFLNKMSENSPSEQLSLLGDKITGLSEAGLLRELGYQGRTFQHGKDGGIVIFNLDNVIKANKVLSEIKEKVNFKNNALKFLFNENNNTIASQKIESEESRVTAESANGMIQGMEEKEQEIYDKAEAIALGALKVVKKALDIKSPSGEFRKVGIAMIEGIIKGMEEKAPDLNNTITNISTNALKISKDIVNQNNSNPLTDLQNAKKNFEPFYKDSKQLATKEGQEAALQYYTAYQKALEAKVNKKDLQANTLGKMSELFSGNYSNYKKGVGAIDTSGLTTTIETTKQKLEQLSQPQTINNLEALTVALQKLTGEGKDVEYLTNMLKSLISVFNLLSNDKSADRLVKIQDNLSKFATSLSQLRIDDNGLLSQIDNILKKSDELKTLSDVIKANKKAIDAAAKGVSDMTALETASNNFNKYYNQINEGWKKLASENSWTAISTQMEPAKDGLIHIKALVREVDDTYKELTYTTTNGDVFGLSKERVDDLALQKKINQYKELQTLLDRIIPNAGMIGQVTPDTGNWQELLNLLHRFGFEIENVEKIIRNVDEVGHESFQIFDKLGNRTTLGVDSKEILFAKERVFDLNKDINDFNKSLKELQGLSKKSFKLTNVEAVKLVETIQKLSESFKQLQKGNAKGMLDNDSLAKFRSQYEAIFKDLNGAWFNDQQIKNLNPEFVSRYEDLKVELEQIISLSNSDTFPTTNDIAQLDAFTQKANQFYTDMANNNQKMSSAGSVDKLLGKIGKTLSDNDGMTKELKTQFEELIGRIKLARNESTGMLPTDEMKSFSAEYERLKNAMIESGKTGKNFWSLTKDRLKSTNAQLVSMYFSFYRLIGYARTMVSTIIELDSALLDLKKTTTMNNSELEEFYRESSNTAKEVGVTTKEIISQAAAWSRLGFSSKEAATEMAKLSSQFAKISPGTSVEDATDYLVSTMKAFHIDVADVESEIMDSINKIGNTMATSNAEVGEMLKRSSAAMAEANNSLAETIALESAAVQITRNAETTGTAFRTISMRIRGYDEETEELSEDLENISGVIADLTKTASKPGGISLFTDATKTTYKSTYQLLKEIAEIYHDLTDKQQASLLEKLAGKRGGQVLAGILNDFSEVERAMSEIENSAGSAAKEMSVVEETLEYKINAFKTTWTGMIQTLVDKGTIGDVVDFFTSISEGIASIVNNKPALIATVSALSGLIISLKGGNFLDLIKLLKAPGGGLLTGLFGGSQYKDFDATKIINIYKGLGSSVQGEVDKAKVAMAGLTNAEQDLIIKSQNAGTSVEQFSASMNSISVGARIAKTALATLANTAVMLAITLAIKALSKAYDEWAHKASKAAEKAKELRDAFDSAQKSAKNNLESFDKLSNRAKELSNGVDALGRNVSLTADEFDEYKQIQQTIAEMSPQLISGYDEQGKAIINLKGRVDDLRQSYVDAQAAAYDLMIVGTGEDGSGNATTMTEDFLNMFRPGDYEMFMGNKLSVDAKQRIAKFVRDNSTHLNFSDELIDFYNELSQEGYGDQVEIFLKELGIEYRLFVDGMSDAFITTNIEQTRSLAATMYQTLETSKQEGLNTYKQLFNSFLKRTGSEYYDLNEDYQKIVSNVINNIDLATAYELAEQGTGAVSEWVETQISYLKDMPNEYSNAIRKLELGDINFKATEEAFNSLYDYLTNILGLDPNHPLVSYVTTLYEGADSTQVAKKLGIDLSDNRAISYWQKFLDELPDKDIQLVLNADEAPLISTIQGAEEWIESLRNKYIEETTSTIVQSVKQFNDELEPQFNALASAYDQIFNNEKGFKAGLQSIDVAWFNNIRSAFGEISEDLDIDFDISNVEAFFNAIENGGEITEKVAHDAFDDLATAYFYSAEGLQNLNDKTRNSIQQMMVQMGITKESAQDAIDTALAYKEVSEGLEMLARGARELGESTEQAKAMNEALALSVNDVIFADKESFTAIQKKILAYYEEVGATEAVRMASFLLALQEMKEASIKLNVNDKISALENLASAYLSAAEAAAFEARMESLRAGAKYGDTSDRNRIEAELNDVSGLVATAFNQSIEKIHLNYDHVVDQAGSAGSESGKTYADEFEEALKNLQFLRDNDIITLKHYLDQEKKLIDDFYRAGKMSAEDYFKYIHDWLREMLDLYNSVISDVTKLLQKEIDKLEKERDNRVKEIEKERDAALEAIDAETEALEKKIKKKSEEIELLEKANEKRKQEIDLQKALYNMERARNQRTLLQYQEGADGKGQLVYRPDEKAVRDAQEEVEEQQYQKRLKILQDELELLNEEKDKLSEQREEIEKHYQELIDQTNEYYDNAIEKIQEYMEMWEELAEIEERALMQSRLESLGLSIEDILNLDIDSFEAFKENYLGILADIYRENGSMTKALGDQAGDLTSYLGKMQQYFDSLSGIDLSSVASAMATVAPAIQTIADCMPYLVPEELRNNLETTNGTITETEQGVSNTGTALEDMGNKGKEGTDKIYDGFHNVEKSAEDVINAIDGSGGSRDKGHNGAPSDVPKSAFNSKGGGNSLVSSLQTTVTESENAGNAMESGFKKGGEEAHKTASIINTEVAEAIEEIKGPHTIEFNVKLNSKLDANLKNISDNLNLNPAFKRVLTGIREENGTVGNAFANGYPGLNSPEYSALRSEYGQPELTVYPNGTYELTTTPTLSDLPKDTVIFNEEQTKRILKDSSAKGLKGKSFANGTPYFSLQDVMPDKAEMFNKFASNIQDNLSKMKLDITDMSSNLQDITRTITNNMVNNNGNTVNVGDINVTCPGVTEAEVAKNLGAAIRSELNGVVSGMALKANQIGMRR